MFVFCEREGGKMEVWFDPAGEAYRRARETGAVPENNWDGNASPRNVNWIASVVIEDDFDFTLQAPRETA
jgi:hypothetical protein